MHPLPIQSAYHKLAEVIYSNESQLKKLAKALPYILVNAEESVIQGLMDNVKNLCKWVNVMEGVVTTLRANINIVKGKAPMKPGDMYLLEEAISAVVNTPEMIDTLMSSMEISEADVKEEEDDEEEEEK